MHVFFFWCMVHVRTILGNRDLYVNCNWLKTLLSSSTRNRIILDPLPPAMARDGASWEEGMASPLMEGPRVSKHWYVAGAAVAALSVLGVGKASHFSLSASKTLDEIENWEELPGMDTVIEKARSLEPKHKLRNLNRLFFDSQPEEVHWIRSKCVIDTVHAGSSLPRPSRRVPLQGHIDYDGLDCPDKSPVGCAASVAGFITSSGWPLTSHSLRTPADRR